MLPRLAGPESGVVEEEEDEGEDIVGGGYQEEGLDGRKEQVGRVEGVADEVGRVSLEVE